MNVRFPEIEASFSFKVNLPLDVTQKIHQSVYEDQELPSKT